MLSFLSSRWFRWLVFSAVTLPVLVLVAYRAGRASFTHDEAYSYLHYVHMDFLDITALKNPFPNNHILNTLAMKYSEVLFGSSEPALRLPNVLAFLLYGLAVSGILNRLRNKWLMLPAFVLLVANPFFLDFFSLARGYGLSFAMIACSLNRYLLYLDTNRTPAFVGSFVFAGLAFMSNFGTLYFLLALLITHNVIFLFRSGKVPSPAQVLRHNRVPFVCLVVLTLVMYEAVRRMLGLPIDFGGQEGIWKDTVISIITYTSYHNSPAIYNLLFIFVPAVSAVMAAYWLVRLARYRLGFIKERLAPFCFFLMLLLIVTGSQLHHFLTGTPYLRDRFAMYMVPVFWLCVVFLLDSIPPGKIAGSLAFAAAALALVMAVHTVRVLDRASFIYWQYDRDNARVISRVEKERKDLGLEKLRLGITWFYEPAFNYYRKHKGLNWLNELDRNGLTPEDDLRYISAPDTALVPGFTSKMIIERYPLSGSLLLKGREP